ncbi:hypothetical protein Tsubulata_004218 [Turnera subulata]|uniref:Uncharacterized protein n=1 Tax=Turnera subulata TaxID=218843 RepID=A0A9Q0JC47_9ROSI|nr:hypothetical protein Tsubulata_004218 [Turnera subulata]
MGCSKSKNINAGHVAIKSSVKKDQNHKKTAAKKERNQEETEKHVIAGQDDSKDFVWKKEKLYTIGEMESEDDKSFHSAEEDPKSKEEDPDHPEVP